jgi:uncharacterized sodium:solute symporter family permease YidK
MCRGVLAAALLLPGMIAFGLLSGVMTRQEAAVAQRTRDVLGIILRGMAAYWAPRLPGH